MPAAPFVRRVQWALLKLPTVKLNLKVARVLPVTAIPLLSSVLSVLFTKTIPKEFLLPRTQIIDLAQDAAGTSSQANSSSFDLADTLTVTLDGEISSMGLDFEELKLQYPALWALFDSMDTSEPYGELSVEEVVEGLSCDWGFASTSEQDKRALFNLLDENDDGVVSFAEFVSAWPDLRSVFVPRRFDGKPCRALGNHTAL
jgi:EF-hand domain pair